MCNEAVLDALKTFAPLAIAFGVLFAITISIEIDNLEEGRKMKWLRTRIMRMWKIVWEGF